MRIKSALRLMLGGWMAVTAASMPQASAAEPLPKPESLRKRKVPEPSNLDDFIKDKKAAILLGKACTCRTCRKHGNRWKKYSSN